MQLFGPLAPACGYANDRGASATTTDTIPVSPGSPQFPGVAGPGFHCLRAFRDLCDFKHSVNNTNFDLHIPFVDHLGIQLLEKGDGRVRIRFEPKPEHLNSWKGIHGGVIMTLLDVALGSASRALDPACNGATTVELKANFLAGALGTVTAEGRAQRTGRSLIYAEGEVRDDKGVTLAKGSGTFKLLYPAGSRE